MMKTRNRKFFPSIWVHLDATHENYATAINVMRAQHEGQGSLKLSINLKDDGTEALVKVSGVTPTWLASKPWQDVVKRVFTDADHAEAVAMVRDPIWEPTPA